jgi:hypothetical protein
MLAKLRPRLTYANIVSTICLCLVVGGGTAYAANTVFSTDIVDGEVKQQDLANGAVTGGKLAANSVLTPKLADNAVTSAKVLNDTQPGGGLNTQDLATNSVGFSEVSSNSIDSDEIVDFGLTNQDVGVLFAEVHHSGTLISSSGGVTATQIGGDNTGRYEVDFGRNIVPCTPVATLFEGGPGEIIVSDRAGNNEAVLVDTNDSAGSPFDHSFHLVVVC